MKQKLKKLETEIQNYKKEFWKVSPYINLQTSPIKRRFLGIPMPLLREFFKKKSFMFDEVVFFYKNTTINEVQVGMLIVLEQTLNETKNNVPEEVLELIDFCDNWWISDALSSIYAKLGDQSPEKMKIVREKWNKSENLWHRRQSIVSVFYYSRLRKKYERFESVKEMIENILGDTQYYVQKGIGWTLRELYNVYPQQTFEFLLHNVGKIHPHAWQASSEKLSLEEKEILKNKRSKKC